MKRSIFSPRRLVLSCMTALCFAVASPSASAVDVPWINVGSGFIPEGFSVVPGVLKPYQAAGFAVPVGRYASSGNMAEAITFDPLTLSGTFKGDFNFSNRFLGDLKTTFGDVSNGAAEDGTFSAIDQGDGTVRIFFFAEFNPKEGSTGLFRNVTGGSLTMPAISEPFNPADISPEGVTPALSFSWIGFGFLSFGG